MQYPEVTFAEKEDSIDVLQYIVHAKHFIIGRFSK